MEEKTINEAIQENELKNIFPRPDGEKKEPTADELREEFVKMLEEPIADDEVEQASTQLLLCDIQIAQLEQVVAGLKAQIADQEAEIAKHRLAKAIITRRLANNEVK